MATGAFWKAGKTENTYHQGRFLLRICLDDVGHLVIKRQVKLELWLVWAAWESQHNLPKLNWTMAFIHIQKCGRPSLIWQPVCYLIKHRHFKDKKQLLTERCSTNWRRWIFFPCTYISYIGNCGWYSHKSHGETCIWVLWCSVDLHSFHPAHYNFQGCTTDRILHHMHLEKTFLHSSYLWKHPRNSTWVQVNSYCEAER